MTAPAAPALPPTLTAAQAARALGVSRSTMDARLRDGTVPYCQLGRRGRRRVRVRDLLVLGVTREAVLAAIAKP